VVRDKAIEDCRGALFLTDPEVDRATLITAKGTRVSGTCEWISEDPSYRQWLEGTIPLLWICGGPGKGKTMLTVFLVEALEQIKSVIFYFCTAEDERRNNASAVLRSLLWQITKTFPDLAEHFLTHLGAGDSTASRRMEASLSSVETLWMMFITMCRDPRVSRLALILDGLDECDQKSRDWLASKFCDLRTDSDSKHTHPPKVIIVSRDIPLLRLCSRIRLDPDNEGKIGKDVECFVAESVQKLWAVGGFDEKHRQPVAERLLERSEGTFLWVGFAIAELKTKRTVLEVEQCLGDMPAGLPAFYGRMLQQIPTQEQQKIAKLLQWTTLSARPLSLPELAEAIPCKATKFCSAEEVVRDLVTLCHPFLVVQRKAGSPARSITRQYAFELQKQVVLGEEIIEPTQKMETVNLIHQSARDFMDSSEMPDAFRFEHEKVQFEMAWRCMNLLQESTKEFTGSREMSLTFRFRSGKVHREMDRRRRLGQWRIYAAVTGQPVPENSGFENLTLEEVGKKNLMLEYAVEHWPAHALKASSLAKSLLRHPNGFFDEPSIVRSWWYHQRRDYSRLPCLSDSIGLSAYVGFVPWIEKVLAGGWLRKPEVNRRSQATRQLSITPLEHAAVQGHGAAMRTLLEHGARADWLDTRKYVRPPIHIFAASGNVMAVRICLDHGTNLVAAGKKQETPLHLAAAEGHTAVVQLLIAAGADLEAHDVQQATALMKAANRNQDAIVRMLLNCGAEVRTKNGRRPSAFDLAAEEGNESIMRMLLDRGAFFDKATALRLAASRGDEAEVKLQLDGGVPVDAIDYSGLTALFCAALGDHNDVVELLIARGANIILFVTACDYDGGMTTIDNSTYKILQHQRLGRAAPAAVAASQRCESVTDVNAVDYRGRTPLHLGVNRVRTSRLEPEENTWHVSLIRALLDQGAKIETGDEQGLTALHYAVRDGNSSVAKLLLDRGAKIEARDHKGRTSLQVAADQRWVNAATLNLLLDHGVGVESVDVVDENGLTSLHHAVCRGDQRGIRRLLDRQAQVDARDHRGRTPLHLAAESSSGNMYPLVLLLDHGADINARDLEGLTPLNHADKVTNGRNALLLRYRGAV
jgi:ankyrin repeat protein